MARLGLCAVSDMATEKHPLRGKDTQMYSTVFTVRIVVHLDVGFSDDGSARCGFVLTTRSSVALVMHDTSN